MTEDCIFYDKEEFAKLWMNLKFLGSATEGTCKKLNNREAIKYLNGIDDRGHTKDTILKYKNIVISSYLFAYKVFYIDKILSGYITKISSGKNLIEVDRDKIIFDDFIKGVTQVEKDTKYISNNGIEACDILFNILYKNGVFHIIDTCEYSNSDSASDKLYKRNISSFNYSILEFLIKDRFYDFVFSSKELKDYYINVENGESIIGFLELLKEKLSEYCDNKITTVKSAKKAITLSHNSIYPEYY